MDSEPILNLSFEGGEGTLPAPTLSPFCLGEPHCQQFSSFFTHPAHIFCLSHILVVFAVRVLRAATFYYFYIFFFQCFPLLFVNVKISTLNIFPFQSNLTDLPRSEFVPGIGLGIAKCPYDPLDNSTAIYVERGNPGGLPGLVRSFHIYARKMVFTVNVKSKWTLVSKLALMPPRAISIYDWISVSI